MSYVFVCLLGVVVGLGIGLYIAGLMQGRREWKAWERKMGEDKP